MKLRIPTVAGLGPTWADVRFGIFFGLLASAMVMAYEGHPARAGALLLAMLLVTLLDYYIYRRRPPTASSLQEPIHHAEPINPLLPLLIAAFKLDDPEDGDGDVRPASRRTGAGPRRLH